MKRYCFLLLVLLIGSSYTSKPPDKQGPVILAYVTSWSDIIPDPHFVTHINYAFGHVNKSFSGVHIDNEDRLKEIVQLKQQKPSLKVLLSIGGWGSGRFSEMAADKVYRMSFAKDCDRVIKQFDLDGIDIDWEFPTSSMAGISSSPEDTKNFTLLVHDIRKAIGRDKLLTMASQAGAGYVDFKAINSYINFVNIMTYDMGAPPNHHASLYRSEYTGWMSADESVDAHINTGIPVTKLVLGIPFYGHGKDSIDNFIDYKDIINLSGYTVNWDTIARVPYLTNSAGDFVCTYEDIKSIGIKCEYVLQRKMLGAMYWDYDGDDKVGSLRRAVYNGIVQNQKINR